MNPLYRMMKLYLTQALIVGLMGRLQNVEATTDLLSINELCDNQCKLCTPGKTSPSMSLTASLCHNRCKHGHCVTDPSSRGYHCVCFDGYTGTTCDREINECSSNPCGSNGLKCVDQVAKYHCVCKVGYAGKHCQIT